MQLCKLVVQHQNLIFKLLISSVLLNIALILNKTINVLNVLFVRHQVCEVLS